MRTRRLFFISVSFFVLINFAAVGQTKKILFLGNSLTYYNDLPATLEKIARQGGKKITYTSLLKPNYGVEDHWIEGKAATEIKTNSYDVVLLQQGPSSLNESRATLIEYSQYFERICKQNNTAMAFYMVWPSKDRFGDFQRVMESYAIAADTTHSMLCPAGRAWLEAWKIDQDLPLYGPDNFHPSPQGSLLAALVIYGVLFETNDLGFIRLEKLKQASVTPKEFAVLREAAQKVLAKK